MSLQDEDANQKEANEENQLESPNNADFLDSPKDKTVHSQSDSGQIQQDSPLKMITDSGPSAPSIKKRKFNEFIKDSEEEVVGAAANS